MAGTRVPVGSIVVKWQHNRDLERVRSAFPRLSIRATHAALAYCEAHREEIERPIEENGRIAYAAD